MVFIYVVGGVYSVDLDENKLSRRVQVFDHSASKWTYGPEMSSPRGSMGLVSHEGKIYSVAGEDKYGSSGQFDVLNVKAGQVPRLKCAWKSLAPLIRSRNFLGAAVIGSHIYAMGGDDPYVFRKEDLVEIYDINNPCRRWFKGPQMGSVHAKHGVAAQDGKVYVLGGVDQSGKECATSESFCPTAESWSYIKPMPSKRCFCSAASTAGRVFVCGGTNYRDADIGRSVVAFDPKSGDWSEVAPMLVSRQVHAVVECNGNLFALGGDIPDSGGKMTSSVEIYDPRANAWMNGVPMLRPVSFHGAVTLA